MGMKIAKMTRKLAEIGDFIYTHFLEYEPRSDIIIIVLTKKVIIILVTIYEKM